MAGQFEFQRVQNERNLRRQLGLLIFLALLAEVRITNVGRICKTTVKRDPTFTFGAVGNNSQALLQASGITWQCSYFLLICLDKRELDSLDIIVKFSSLLSDCHAPPLRIHVSSFLSDDKDGTLLTAVNQVYLVDMPWASFTSCHQRRAGLMVCSCYRETLMTTGVNGSCPLPAGLSVFVFLDMCGGFFLTCTFCPVSNSSFNSFEQAAEQSRGQTSRSHVLDETAGDRVRVYP
ncbi:hypothetical protein E1301_Tti003222 [Triplophysa tibetana]|uniref:Uncharacterized protein n=1 Tax=Triplophysa tibetana TaxID=1572043 RepID=A0A5A9PP85_9TELE|nr:hypothetical protein E1301_Tti003222 [Triplophysa tibetana]